MAPVADYFVSLYVALIDTFHCFFYKSWFYLTKLDWWHSIALFFLKNFSVEITGEHSRTYAYVSDLIFVDAKIRKEAFVVGSVFVSQDTI